MKKIKVSLMIYGFITITVVCLNGYNVIINVKYAITLSLLLLMLLAYLRGKSTLSLLGAFIFVAIGDFFLVFLKCVKHNIAQPEPIGAFFFFLAYICLIMYYRKDRTKVGFPPKSSAVILFLSGTFALNLATSDRSLQDWQVLGLFLFEGVIAYMVWLSFCNMYKQSAAGNAAKALFVSAVLMYICDSCVAFNYLHPDIPELNQLAKALTWLSYIPAWSLLAVVTICDRQNSDD